MSDIKQSGSLEEDADLVVGLYRDEYYKPDSKQAGLMELIILKNRNGPVGTVTVDFTKETNKIVGD
jgi:replicative DNA helicase